MTVGSSWIQGLRIVLILCLALIGLGGHSGDQPLAWRLIGFVPALVLLAFVVIRLERQSDPPRGLGWAWVGVFNLVVVALAVATFGETIHRELLAVLFLGLVVATARTLVAGALVGIMSAIGYCYLTFQHQTDLDMALLIGVSLLLVTAGVSTGLLSQEADLRRAELHAETAELRRELADLGDYLRNVLSCVASGVLVVDSDERITTINRAAQRILGLPEHSVLGRPTLGVPALSALQPVFQGQPEQEPKGAGDESGIRSSPRRDVEFLRPDGQTVRIGFALTNLENLAGRQLGKILVFQDVTLIRDYETRMLRQEQLAALGRMISGIAHEFGNVLGGARGLLDLALQEEPHEAVTSLPLVRETLGRALETVDNLLKFARGTPLNRLPGVELHAVLDRALHLIRADLERHGVEVEQHLDPVPPIAADAVQLEQVFINIIINAIHALEGRDERRLRISLDVQGKETRVRFEDTGPGVTDKEQARIFEPFFTTKGSLSGSNTPGTGLGLSVALGVIQDHEGTLAVSRSPDLKGACFTITLPSTNGEATSSS